MQNTYICIDSSCKLCVGVCEIDASECSWFHYRGHFKTVNLANSLYKYQDIGFSLFFKVIRLLFA